MLVVFCHRQKFPETTTRDRGETQRIFHQADEPDRGGQHARNGEATVVVEVGIGVHSIA